MAKAKFTVFKYRQVLIAGVFGNHSCLGTGQNQIRRSGDSARRGGGTSCLVEVEAAESANWPFKK
ncbi:MAG: hypothetical protein WAM76_04825 [Pseudolabrys sp.]